MAYHSIYKCVCILWHPACLTHKICIQVKTVSANLEPGTSMNVTLKGNYTKMEGPYKAKLKSYYADSSETKTRDIEGIVSITSYTLFRSYIIIVDSSYKPFCCRAIHNLWYEHKCTHCNMFDYGLAHSFRLFISYWVRKTVLLFQCLCVQSIQCIAMKLIHILFSVY